MIDPIQHRTTTGLFHPPGRKNVSVSTEGNPTKLKVITVFYVKTLLLLLLASQLSNLTTSSSIHVNSVNGNWGRTFLVTCTTTIKSIKCWPAVDSMPDLIQTVHTVRSRASCPHKLKKNKMKKEEEKIIAWIEIGLKITTMSKMTENIFFKCQPAASDIPDLIQTVCVADRGLACPKKSTEHKKYNTKCQPIASDTSDLIQTVCVADSGLVQYTSVTYLPWRGQDVARAISHSGRPCLGDVTVVLL